MSRTAAVALAALMPLSVIDSSTSEDSVVVQIDLSTRYSPAPASLEPQTIRYRRIDALLCQTSEAQRSPQMTTTCQQLALARRDVPDCSPDEILLEALFTSQRDEGDTWGTWELVSSGECIGPADLADEAARAFHEMQIQPATLTVQPPNGWTIVHFDTIVHTQNPDTAAQETTTELLGIPVQIRAQPTEYT
ncbi:hypothetical protein [Paraoerskovia marina]|uniref:hypothetical protein n=1 Tax=Paraoerskovia marina TaxID=545619 RepID=UPI0012F7AA05|nr:hypothetical protein [Paraoerskovia marina]